MRPQFRQDRSPRRHRPECEGLEARDLLSTLPVSTASPSPSSASSAAMVRKLTSAGVPAFPNPEVIANSINLLYGPNSQTPRTPTPAEVNRQTFTAKYIGTYTVGLPRFNDRSMTIHVYSKTGGSNQFLKGKLQLVIFPPANPNAQPNPGNPYANQVTGIAAVFTQNYLQTGGMAVLDLNGLPAPGAGPFTLPTHLNWTYDSFSSSGPYTGPVLDFNQGTGIVDIQYIPDRHPQPGTMGSGRLIVAFQGVINTNQITSAIAKAIN
jgi:hypothetical protein